MVSYEKSIIYKLCCKDTDVKDIYIGSTTNFTRRKCEHKGTCNNPNCKQYNYNVYKYIRNNGTFDNWDMVQIEEYKAKDKRDLHTRERYWIELLESKLNCVIPTRNKKEYRSENKVNIKEHSMKYRANNKDMLTEKNRIYNSENKDKIKEKNKKYYFENKKKVICECGSEVCKNNLSHHRKTQKHIKYLESLTTHQ